MADMNKNFFLKRRNAILITIAVILLATVFGVHRSLGSRIMEVADGFNDGVYNQSKGYNMKSIRSQLIIRCETAMDALTVAEHYDAAEAERSALRSARNTLKDLLDGNGSPSELYDANYELDRAFTALYTALNSVSLSAADREYIDNDRSRMDGAAGVIEDSGYNESVRAFQRDVLSVFPTNLLRPLCFVKDPELFE